MNRRKWVAVGLALVPVVGLALGVWRLSFRIPQVLFETAEVISIQISPDGNLLLAKAYLSKSTVNPAIPDANDRGYLVWNLASGKMEVRQHSEEVDSPFLWDQARGRLIRAVSRPWPDEKDMVSVTLERTKIATGTTDKRHSHLIRGPGVLRAFNSAYCPLDSDCWTKPDLVSFSPRHDRLRVLSAGFVSEFDANSGNFIRDIRICSPGETYEDGLFTPDGRILLANSKRVREVTLTDDTKPSSRDFPAWQLDSLTIMEGQFSPGGEMAAFTRDYGSSRSYRFGDCIYDAKTWRQLWEVPPNNVFAAFSYDGKSASVWENQRNLLQVRNSRTGAIERQFPGIQSPTIAISNDGRWLYEARAGHVIRWYAG